MKMNQPSKKSVSNPSEQTLQIYSKAYAEALDEADELKNFREKFLIPEKDGRRQVYFCGNSLGLQPKSVRSFVEETLEDWKKHAVEGHFEGKTPWMYYHKLLSKSLAKLVGAKTDEVVTMNSLTVNLHLMMVSFYRPVGKRCKILVAADAFPSDKYAVASQLRFHGYDPAENMLELRPRTGEYTLRKADILDFIAEKGDEIALILLGAVNYYTGQYFPIKEIAAKGQAVGAKVGVDLAHAIGNVALKLHEWGVDFACWCTYKYLNSGPGGVAGLFVHEKYARQTNLPRFAGWWGHDEKTRFLMEDTFRAIPGAQGWQLSNGPILLMSALRASLEIFDQTTMEKLIEKSRKMNSYLRKLLALFNSTQSEINIEIITPEAPQSCGCQLSLVVSPEKEGKKLFDYLNAQGVIGDWRMPNVIRLAPAPLYNTFSELLAFYQILKKYKPEQG